MNRPKHSNIKNDSSISKVQSATKKQVLKPLVSKNPKQCSDIIPLNDTNSLSSTSNVFDNSQLCEQDSIKDMNESMVINNDTKDQDEMSNETLNSKNNIPISDSARKLQMIKKMDTIIEYLKNINTFKDLYDITEDMSKTDKGYLFEVITLYLFKLVPMLSNDLEEIWLYNNIPTEILKSLKLPTRDKGIDLLARIKGKYYSIQCKFRQNAGIIIPWGDLSTFFGLSFGLHDKIAGGYLVTNTFDLCKEVTDSNKVTAIYGEYFDTLPENFFQNICKDLTNQKPIPYVIKKPFKHQQECIDKCREYFGVNRGIELIEDSHESEADSDNDLEINEGDTSRGYTEMACGSGKSLNSYWIDKELTNSKTVVFVPSLYLLTQFFTDWINQSHAENVKIDYLLVGSDVDIDEDTMQKVNGVELNADADKDEKTVQKSNGVKSYTDPEEIRSFIDLAKGKLVVISTYQSSDKLAEACNKDIEFDFGVFDEAHKTVGQAGKKFSLMLTDDKLVIKKRLFMTATPKVYGGNLEDENILSMDNEKYYGKQIYCYNTGNAINDKMATDYQLVSIVATNKEIEGLITKNKLVQYKDEFEDEESQYLGSILILLKKMHDGTCNHMFTFHNTVDRANKFKKFLEKINELLYKDEHILVNSLDGSTSMLKRKKIVKDFEKAKKAIICSARVFNEGVNIPIVDSVCFVDARFSTIDIVQCVGRGLRIFDGKKIANIFVPTFVENIDHEFDDKAFWNIIAVLKAMKSTDDGVTEFFSVKNDNKKTPRKIFAIEKYSEINMAVDINLVQWNQNIQTKIWSIVDPFDNNCKKFIKYISNHDNYPSRQSSDLDERCLARWIKRVRELKRKNILDRTKILKLESIGRWNWNSENQVFDKLKQWIEDNKKLPSTTKNKTKTEKNLAQWCERKRSKYRQLEISKDEIEQLEKLPGWYWEKGDFEIYFNKLKEWIEKYDKLPTPKKSKEENKLAVWCSNRRQENKNNKLDAAKIDKLNTIEKWFWGNEIKKKIKSFDELYSELVEWIKINKKMPGLTNENSMENVFFYWCSRMKTKKTNDKLTNEQIHKLELIPNWRWTRV
ncbi:MAG: superfamily II helicase [Hyperionvirus sp.]|uniref:Superfamily II helicase n=1 Tax=Hyperionvirus sp. TaxID=2487770 RepID=A0A3G5AD06_9VIRU|nr:MAG: superfamily II helicase [Hyperionvirus sp.]